MMMMMVNEIACKQWP